MKLPTLLIIRADNSEPNIKAGTLMELSGENVSPEGEIADGRWLIADGRTLPPDQYPDLFAAIGNLYSEGQDVFKLPDCRNVRA